ncbi:hypothetical protein SEUCBS139899_002478 [Sporothrix eucalyptigena]|uniref:Transcription factor TFIIIC triple barrel domain-containing protein n=1 Tax=Sporothrix eucalyptigena TaxID=1812306 RepID=A0ABP0B3W2_9PEZI
MTEPSPPPPPEAKMTPPVAAETTTITTTATEAAPLPSPMPSPSKTAAMSPSPSILPKLAPATAKRKRDADGDDIEEKQPPPFRTTIALHSGPGPRFSLIAPKPLLVGIEADGTPPYAFGVRALSPESGGNSPRTRVADRFQSLAIQERYFDVPCDGEAGDEAAAVNHTDTAVASAASAADTADTGPLHKRIKRDDVPNPSEDDIIVTKDGRVIIDPVRASLTWQDDEITVYDPNDADDDGTGVNGIGFKPTPAIAHERALKRRQQLAAYRKREEREARARRSLQRTRAHQAAAAAARLTMETVSLTTLDSPRTPRSHAAATAAATAAAASLSSPPSTASSPVRRVRFLETGPVTIRFKEPDTVPSPTSILTSS